MPAKRPTAKTHAPSPVHEHVSKSIQQLISQLERRWNGLCVQCCLALNWPLSLENLGAVKASLLLIYVRQFPVASPGGTKESPPEAWSTFAQKVLADLRRDSARILMNTKWSWMNCRQSSLTRRIYANRRTRQRLRQRSSRGWLSTVRSAWLSSILSVLLRLAATRTRVKTWAWFSPTANSFIAVLARSLFSYTTQEKIQLEVHEVGRGFGRRLIPKSRSLDKATTALPASRR